MNKRASNMTTMNQSKLNPDQIADAERLKRLFLARQRVDRTLTQEKLAFDLGWKTQGAVYHYLNGKTPLNLSALLKFANYFGVRPVEISPRLADALPEYVDPETDTLRPVDSGFTPEPMEKGQAIAARYFDDPVYIKVAHEVMAVRERKTRGKVATAPNLLFQAAQPEEIPLAWLARRGLDSDQIGYLYAPDDSLSPAIARGALVLIDTRDQSEIADGQVYAIQISGALKGVGGVKLRRLLQMPARVLAVSDNPSKFPNIELNGATIDFGIIGRAVFVISDL